MRITRIQLDEVVVRARPDSINSPELDHPLHMLTHGGRSAWSVQYDEIPKLILQLETDAGVTGVGEFYRGLPSQAVLEIAQGLLGTDLNILNLQALPVPAGRIYDGFETAVLDAVGRHRNLPLHALLGGKYRDTVYAGYWTG